jgi:hypothetical protein
MVVGTDPFGRAHRAWAEPRPGPVGHAKVERHAGEHEVESTEVIPLRRVEPQRRTEQRGNARVRFRPPVGAGKDGLGNLAESRIARVAGRRVCILGAQRLELVTVHGAPLCRLLRQSLPKRFPLSRPHSC